MIGLAYLHLPEGGHTQNLEVGWLPIAISRRGRSPAFVYSDGLPCWIKRKITFIAS
jgi:hypothetical protein